MIDRKKNKKISNLFVKYKQTNYQGARIKLKMKVVNKFNF